MWIQDFLKGSVTFQVDISVHFTDPQRQKVSAYPKYCKCIWFLR